MSIYSHLSWAIHDSHKQITIEVSSLTDWCQNVNLKLHELDQSNSRYHVWLWRTHNG